MTAFFVSFFANIFAIIILVTDQLRILESMNYE